MVDRRQRLQRALRGCAEAGVPENVDLWPTIHERVTALRASEARRSGPTGNAAQGRARVSQLAPNSPLGWMLAALSVLIVGLGLYAASALLRDLARSGLPGAAGTGETTHPGEADGSVDGEVIADRMFRSEVPGAGDERLRQTGTTGGARVTLVRAYADADSVVVAFTVEDLKGERRVGGHPAELQPGYDLGSSGVRLTDESGTEFKLVSGGGQVASGPNNILEGPKAHSVVFEPEGEMDPDTKHRFRLEMPILEVPVTPPGTDGDEFRRVGEHLSFAFEVPVRPAPVFEVNRRATANGTTLILKRVTDSPGQPKAVVCLESADGVRGWFPIGKDLSSEAPGQVAGEGNCLEVMLDDPLAGRSSFTIAQIELNPFEGEMIRGPWTFEFEVPKTPGT